MNNSQFKIILNSLIVLALFMGCSDDSGSPTSGGNNPPVIRSVTATPNMVEARSADWEDAEHSSLTCVATDQDGDSLTYFWYCPTASILEGYNNTEQITRMYNFDQGENWIRVTVSDGMEIDVDSVKVIGT
jgi:hypothetical protein